MMQLEGNEAYLSIHEQKTSEWSSPITIDPEVLDPIHEMQEDALNNAQRLEHALAEESDTAIGRSETIRKELAKYNMRFSITKSIVKAATSRRLALSFREQLEEGFEFGDES